MNGYILILECLKIFRKGFRELLLSNDKQQLFQNCKPFGICNSVETGLGFFRVGGIDVENCMCAVGIRILIIPPRFAVVGNNFEVADRER